MRIPFLAALFCASSAYAEEVSSFSANHFAGQDVVIVGEVHDNPDHHLTQAEIIAMIGPTAVVFEMLTAEQAMRVTSDTIDAPDLGGILGWEDAGWPDFTMYASVFAASRNAKIIGAAPSDFAARQARDDIILAFRDSADAYGLTQPLPAEEQAAREQGMQDGHCGALPPDILPWFVDQQRFRDAVFARATVQASERLGGPIVVITGNGHARRDWGMPVYLTAAVPDLKVLSIGQITQADPDAPFGLWRITEPVDRPDPCAAFK